MSEVKNPSLCLPPPKRIRIAGFVYVPLKGTEHAGKRRDNIFFIVRQKAL